MGAVYRARDMHFPLGASVIGSAAGWPWIAAGWPGVVAFLLACTALLVALALVLRRLGDD